MNESPRLTGFSFIDFSLTKFSLREINFLDILNVALIKIIDQLRSRKIMR